MKILYIENHPKFSSIISKYLLSKYIVLVIPSIAEAKLKISSEDFDVILVDYDLDDGKGVEIMPFLKALNIRPKIIAVSSHEAGNNALLEVGADAICYKKDISNIEGVIKSLA